MGGEWGEGDVRDRAGGDRGTGSERVAVGGAGAEKRRNSRQAGRRRQGDEEKDLEESEEDTNMVFESAIQDRRPG